MENSELKFAQMVQKLKVLKSIAPIALFLGAKAGALLRSQYLYLQLHNIDTNLTSFSPSERFSRCYRILTNNFSADDIQNILANGKLLAEIKPQVPELCVAHLMKQGVFNFMLSTGVYQEFEQAFAQIGMERNRDFSMYWPKKHAMMPAITTNKPGLFTYYKLFGDIYDGCTIKDRLNYIHAYKDLEQVADALRTVNMVIIGLDPVWDRDIIPALFPRSGMTWYANDEMPPENSALYDYLRECKVELFLGTEGYYENFITTLCGDMTGTIPTYQQHTPERGVYLQPYHNVQVRNDAKEPLQIAVEILYSYVPSGVLAYYDEETMPLIKYEITNNENQTLKVFLRSEIKGFSFTCDSTVDASVQKNIFYQLPRLEIEKARLLTEIRSVPVNVHVSYLKDGEECILWQHDYDVHLMARNVIRWAVPGRTKSSSGIPLLRHVAAWVTPNRDSIQAMLRHAVDYHPLKALSGYPVKLDPDVPRSQVQAIFQALKEVGKLAYVDSSFAIGATESEVVQMIRLPYESLRDRLANCIDGAVLYASLMEKVSLQPVIIIQTGHAFVGWKIARNRDEYEFLETTMTASASFDEALAEGMKQYRQLQRNGMFDREPFDRAGFAQLLDIQALHKAGIYPME